MTHLFILKLHPSRDAHLGFTRHPLAPGTVTAELLVFISPCWELTRELSAGSHVSWVLFSLPAPAVCIFFFRVAWWPASPCCQPSELRSPLWFLRDRQQEPRTSLQQQITEAWAEL